MSSHPVAFTKGHGTQNDFVLIDDPDGELAIEPGFVRTLSDRRTGLGADGLIRVIRSAALARVTEATDPATAAAARKAAEQGAEWFMDYLNADGSAAEMCGNGIRVLGAHLARRGWIDLAGEVPIGTRGGVKVLRADGELIATGMGGWYLEGGAAAVAAGGDVTVQVHVTEGAPHTLPALPGLSVNTGNPHVVVLLPDAETLTALDLTRPPVVEPTPPHGANVEFVVPTGEQLDGDRLVGHVAMRVHERGVGETRSCGTGAVAVALAVRAFAGAAAPDEWQLDVPGGRLRVKVPAGTSAVQGDAVELAGPAELVAEGELLLPVGPSPGTH